MIWRRIELQKEQNYSPVVKMTSTTTRTFSPQAFGYIKSQGLQDKPSPKMPPEISCEQCFFPSASCSCFSLPLQALGTQYLYWSWTCCTTYHCPSQSGILSLFLMRKGRDGCRLLTPSFSISTSDQVSSCSMMSCSY